MAPLPKGMEHVDRAELYTSLPARVTYLQQFLEFGPDDVVALIQGQKYIKQVIPAIVNMVYKKLLRHDITARVFSQRDSRSEENPDQWPTEDASLIQHRKMFLRWYLNKLNSDPTKMEYWEYLDKVGLMHVGVGRRNPLHVDYIFLGACLGYIQDALTEAILSHPRLPLDRKIGVVKAVGKVIWIQNDLLARWHMEEGRAFLNAQMEAEAEETAAEREGYLHGKKILGDGPEGNNNSNNGNNARDEGSSHSGSSGSGAEDDGISVRSGVSRGSGKTSLGRDRDEVAAAAAAEHGDDPPMRCPFSGLGMERQRSEGSTAKARATPPPQPQPHVRAPSGSGLSPDVHKLASPSGIPRLHIQEGRTMNKEKLDPNPFGAEDVSAGGKKKA